MSKGYSGLFSGTIGAKIYSGMRKQLQIQVIQWATYTAEKLESKSKRQRKQFNTATVVYDESTGKHYNGRNHGIEINHEAKNFILFGSTNSVGLLPTQSLNNFAVGNCAEVHAINKALNDGANLKNLSMYTIHTTKENFGKDKTACENCTYAFKGKIKQNFTGWKGTNNG